MPPSVQAKPPQVQVEAPKIAPPSVGIPKPVPDEMVTEEVTIATRQELATLINPAVVQSAGSEGAALVIDIDDAEIEGENHHSYGIAGDARVCLEALYRLVSARAPAHPSRTEEVRAINEARFDPSIQLQPQHDLLQAIIGAPRQLGVFQRHGFIDVNE